MHQLSLEKQSLLYLLKTEDIEYTEKQLERFRLGLPFKSVWIIDKNMPILKGEDRIYVDKWIYYPEGE